MRISRSPLDARKRIAAWTSKSEFLRKLRRLGAVIETARGKGGHVAVTLNGRMTVVPTGSGELPEGAMRAILRQLGLRRRDLN